MGETIKDVFGRTIFGINTYHLKHRLTKINYGEVLACNLDFIVNLGTGTYSISLALHSSYNHLDKNYEWRDLALIFDVINPDKAQFIGSTWLPPAVAIQRLQTSAKLCDPD